MPEVPGLVPILLLTQIVTAQDRDPPAPAPRAPQVLPIRTRDQGKTIEVPPSTRRLGWKPDPLREIAVRHLDPPGPGDDMAVDEIPEEGLGPIPVEFREYALKPECFDLWIYGNLTVERRTIWLLAALSSKVIAIRDRGFSPEEEAKLILAGRGDIKHFFDKVEAQRPAFEASRRDLVEVQEFLLSIQPLSVEFQLGLYDFGSLFSKTLRKIENDRKASGEVLPATKVSSLDRPRMSRGVGWVWTQLFTSKSPVRTQPPKNSRSARRLLNASARPSGRRSASSGRRTEARPGP